MLVFPHGLLNRKHEYLLAVQAEVPKIDGTTERLRVFNNHNDPMRCLPKHRDLQIEMIIEQVQRQYPHIKITEIHCVDLGPPQTVFNWFNKKDYVDSGVN